MPGASVLKLPDYRNLWYGQTTSQFGDAVYMLVLTFMTKKITGSDQLVGAVAALQALPFLLFGPYAGVLADRIDRKRLMMFADIASATVLAGLGVLILANPNPHWTVIAASGFLLSSVNTFFMPARTASIPRLVPKEQVLEANAFALATQQAVGIVGLALAAAVLGPLYELAPSQFFLTAIAINAATFLVSASFIYRLPAIVPLQEEARDKHFLTELKAGLRVIRADALLKVGLPAHFLWNLSVSGFTVLYIAANEEWFGGSFSTLSWQEFGFVVGLGVASLLVAKFNIRRPGMSYGISLTLVGVAVLALAWAENYWVFMFWNVVAGITIPFAVIPMSTYMQTSVKDEFRGRVASAWTTSAMGAQPIGLAIAGKTLAILGLGGTFIAMGIAMMVVAMSSLLSRGFRTTTLPERQSAAAT